MVLRRTVAILVTVALLVAIVAVVSALAARARPASGDFNRCLSTCNTVVKYYSAKRPTLRTHEGDKQCWSTCNTRFSQKASSQQDMKRFWQTKRDTNLHANQCAQACWRSYHRGSSEVSVAGFRSEPRSTACTGGTAAAR